MIDVYISPVGGGSSSSGAVINPSTIVGGVLRRQTIITADGSTASLQFLGEIAPTVTAGGGTPVVKTPNISPPFGASIFNSTASAGASLGWNGAVSNYVMGRNIAFFFTGYINAVTGERAWIGLTDQSLATMSASDNPAGNYLAFRFSNGAGDLSWQCIAKDGSTQSIVASGIVPVIDASVNLAIVCNDTAGTVTFYINNVSVAVISTHLPPANTILHWSASSFNSAGAGANGLGIGQISIQVDF